MQSFIKIEFAIWKKSIGKGSIFVRNPMSNKRLKTPGQIELNVNFTYNKVSINCFFREQLPSIYTWGCMFYHNEDSASYERFLVVHKWKVT